jgi:hypothetical protein
MTDQGDKIIKKAELSNSPKEILIGRTELFRYLRIDQIDPNTISKTLIKINSQGEVVINDANNYGFSVRKIEAGYIISSPKTLENDLLVNKKGQLSAILSQEGENFESSRMLHPDIIKSIYERKGSGFYGKNGFVSIDKASSLIGMEIKNTCYNYQGNHPKVEYSSEPVWYVNYPKGSRVRIYNRLIALEHGKVKDTTTEVYEEGFKVLSTGARIVTNGNELILLGKEMSITPFAEITMLTEQLFKELEINKKALRILEILDLCMNLDNVKATDKLCYGITNDLANSKGNEKGIIEVKGSDLTDNIARITGNKTHFGGDGGTGYIWAKREEARNLLRTLVFNDAKTIEGTNFGVRTSIVGFNPLPLFNKLGINLKQGDRVKKVIEYLEKVVQLYAEIIQSTGKDADIMQIRKPTGRELSPEEELLRKEEEEQRKKMAIFPLPAELAAFLGIKGQEYQSKGVMTAQKLIPTFYAPRNDDPDSTLIEEEHMTRVICIPSEMINVYME